MDSRLHARRRVGRCVSTSISVDDGVISSGDDCDPRAARAAGHGRRQPRQWSYKAHSATSAVVKIVSQRTWIKATDAAALVTDVRYLAGSLMDRRSVAGLQRPPPNV